MSKKSETNKKPVESKDGAQQPAVGGNGDKTPVFSIEKLYVKDLSLEAPGAPSIFFLDNASPEIEVQLTTDAQHIKDAFYEAVLKVIVSAKTEDKTVFLVEIDQAGIFSIANVPEEQMEPLLAVACPNLLFPYAREAVSSAVSHAGLPPVLLQPVNFEGMYLKRLEDQKKAEAKGAA